MKYLLSSILFLGTLSTSSWAAQQKQVYSLETPGAQSFQARVSLGLQTGTLKPSTDIETRKIEGLVTNFSAAYGVTDMFSFGAQGSYLNSTEKSSVVNASQSGLSDPELYLTTKLAPSAWQLYITLLGGIKVADFEVDSVKSQTSYGSGAYYVEPQVAASTAWGSVLFGALGSYRYHFDRRLSYVSSLGTESLLLDPGHRIRALFNMEVQSAFPWGGELEYIQQDKYEAFSLLGTGQRLSFGNSTFMTASGYVRIPTNPGFGSLDIIPWVSYQINSAKKRGVINYDQDQLLTLMLKLQMYF